MDKKRVGKGDDKTFADIWYPDNLVPIVIPDYKGRYGINEERRQALNKAIFSDFHEELERIGFSDSNVALDQKSDCGMGLNFPVIALLISGTLALPTAIVNVIALVERIKEYVRKKREETRQNDIPTIGLPIFHPKVLEGYCHEMLRKTCPDLLSAGGDFVHVTTIDTSVKREFFYYGVVYLMVFRSSLPTEGLLYQHWAIRVTCTGELLDIKQILAEEHIPAHIYFDDQKAYRKAIGEDTNDL